MIKIKCWVGNSQLSEAIINKENSFYMTNKLEMKSVELFVTCLVDTFFPEIGLAVVELLEQCGLEINFNAQQTCCGQPAFNAGYWQDARHIATHTLDIYDGQEIPVILPSGSCTAMIKHGYPELFKDDKANLIRATALARRTYELSEFLIDNLPESRFLDLHGEKLAYHPACHLSRILQIDSEPHELLRSSKAEIVDLDQECCGFGGVFSVDLPEISTEMLKRKINNIKTSQANTVVSCDVSCLMQIEGGLRAEGSNIRCAHIAQVLTGKLTGLR